jgi:KDO2-lipid IV(A) lauroyltransferase
MLYLSIVILKSKRIVMLSLVMFVSLWICTAKDMRISKYMTWGFLLFLAATAAIHVDFLYLLPLAAIYAGLGIYGLYIKWPEYHGDRKRHFKKKWLKHPAEVVAYHSFSSILRLLPLPVLSWMGGKLLELVGPHTRRQKLIQRNLAMIMPENNNPEFIRKNWNNWGRVFAEGLKFRTYKKHMDRYVTMKNRDFIDRHAQFLLAMPHFGYMGMMSLMFVGAGKKLGVTYKFPSNPLTNRMILENYGLGNVDEAYFIPVGNAMPLMRALKAGDIVNINSDQRPKIGEDLDFMGHVARTSIGLAELACRFNLPVLVGHITRTGGAHHQIVFDEFIHMPDTGDKNRDAVAGMQMVNDAMGRAIMQNPSEYLWAHRRWG